MKTKLNIPVRDFDMIRAIIINKTIKITLAFINFAFTCFQQITAKGSPAHRHEAKPAGLLKLPVTGQQFLSEMSHIHCSIPYSACTKHVIIKM